LPPLLDGHIEEVLRISDPALSWLRQVGIAVEKDKRLDEGLSASELADICQAPGLEFPNKIFVSDLGHLAMYVGRLWVGSIATFPPANRSISTVTR
jgi:hypothetical protein